MSDAAVHGSPLRLDRGIGRGLEGGDSGGEATEGKAKDGGSGDKRGDGEEGTAGRAAHVFFCSFWLSKGRGGGWRSRKAFEKRRSRRRRRQGKMKK